MEQFLRIFLPIYFIVYFGIAFVLKSVIVAKRIGKSPLVLPNDDSAYGLIGRYFKVTMAAMFVYILILTWKPSWYPYFLPIEQIHDLKMQYLGIGLLFIALIWTTIAQGHMKNSWRIGIDTETKTALVDTGLFGYSRNPIFLGMILSLAGLFLVTPNAMTLLFFILGYILIQVQIRLEEVFLEEQHGQVYSDYRKKVRRFF